MIAAKSDGEQKKGQKAAERLAFAKGQDVIPPEKPKRKYGAPFNKDQADTVCQLVAEGANLETLGNDPNNGLPSKTTLYEWRRDNEEFRQAYELARQTRADSRADRVDDIINRMEQGILDHATGRAMIDGILKLAAIENPKMYSEKQRVVHEGGDKPIEVQQTAKADILNRLDKLLTQGGQSPDKPMNGESHEDV